VRIVSLLPSATEALFALGLGDQLVAVTHECDFPLEATALQVVTRSTRDLGGRASALAGSTWPARSRRQTRFAV
jgi:iron complex transport system substrate-binding protein